MPKESNASIVELYERFFKVAYPKVAESLGIVYTPVEIVDFIIRSVRGAAAPRVRRVADAIEGVHILDPFARHGDVHDASATERLHRGG